MKKLCKESAREEFRKNLSSPDGCSEHNVNDAGGA